MLIKRNPKGHFKVRHIAAQKRDAVQVREFYTVSQLADLLQLTEMTIYRMVNRAELPCYAIGRVKRFRHRDIEEFLDSCRIPAATQAQPQIRLPRGAASKAGPARDHVHEPQPRDRRG
jgi:excisionase family DNA binding protein